MRAVFGLALEPGAPGFGSETNPPPPYTHTSEKAELYLGRRSTNPSPTHPQASSLCSAKSRVEVGERRDRYGGAHFYCALGLDPLPY